MEENDLIKKLEKIELPQIELPNHRERLKMVLINWRYFRKKRLEIAFIAKRIVFAGIAVLAMVLLVNNFLIPQDNLAKAQKIALKDPQVKALMEEGGEIKDMEIVNSKAYLLINPKKSVEELVEELSLKTGEIRKVEELAALTEINLKEKTVSKIEKIPPQTFPLEELEKEKAKEIAEMSLEILNLIPKEAEIISIENTTSSRFKLIKEGKIIKIAPEEKKALIIYKLGENKWSKKVNLTREKVESVEFLGSEK
ncbi:hypothetical protein AMJ49_01455 [Parcubacteria bacterium DG_74_2]|nr:MAG: hypothetical protein AMJ49_01455 [Parcubacteria bacterium DG_74_2]